MRTLACVILATALIGLVALAAAPSEALVVEMREFTFRPAVLRVQAGRPVTLRLVNRGQIAHQFEIGALDGDAMTVSDAQMRLELSHLEILRLQPGAAATIWFTPRRRGRFPFACTIEGHREAGMVGVLEVY
jgi:uncharacterized cupredoxin-like copper-binding protein